MESADQSSSPLNAAQVGVGRWGQNIARTIRDHIRGVRLRHVASSRSDIDDLVGRDCRIHADWKELLKADQLDAVFLAVPPMHHAEIATAFIGAGVPVFVEKPMGLTTAECRQLVSIVEASNGILHVNHIDLFHPAIVTIRDECKNGDLRHISGTIGAAYDARPDISPLWEYAPHFIAVSLDLAGSALKQIRAEPAEPEYGAPGDRSHQNTRLLLSFENGVQAEIVAGNAMSNKTRRMRFEFSDQQMIYDDQQADWLVRTDAGGGNPRSVPLKNSRSLTESILAFETRVRGNDLSVESVETGAMVVSILEEATRQLGG